MHFKLERFSTSTRATRFLWITKNVRPVPAGVFLFKALFIDSSVLKIVEVWIQKIIRFWSVLSIDSQFSNL